MTFKMTWALVAEHADEWTGSDFGQAATVLDEKVGAIVSASPMNADAQSHFLTTFLEPLRDSLASDGRKAVESGQRWSAAAGPLLVAVAPAA
ncbi:hypothetical protein [Streptomyces viridochromogenes]|uniref:hypothetical protein n=1 Tax=Streptomyces viridochromogenes TaxID=1938 RepID=UPI00069DAAAE|nr:hypothetical protein [Streptomyces viridochromogenes]KOG26840.1 hypothetical protein ADK36_02495 [Streptomyces viridochromogenes]